MNDFNEKPMDVKVRDTVLKIIERALFYNNTETEQCFTGKKPTFFVNFSGHTASLDVDIHKNGWTSKDDPEEFMIYLTERGGYTGTADEIQDKLISVLKRMEEVYKEWYDEEFENE